MWRLSTVKLTVPEMIAPGEHRRALTAQYCTDKDVVLGAPESRPRPAGQHQGK